MEYPSVAKTAENGVISQRSVRNYCSEGRIPGAFLTGKTWIIPADAEKPSRAKRKDAAPDILLDVLKQEKAAKPPLSEKFIKELYIEAVLLPGLEGVGP